MSAGAVGLGSAARWSALSQGVRLGGQLLSLFLLARLLATSDFGLASIAMVFSGFATLFRDFGTAAAVVQKAELTPRLLNSVFWFNLAVGATLAVLLLLAAWPVSLVMAQPRLAPLLCAFAVIFPLTSAGAVHQAQLERVSDFRSLAIVESVGALAGLAVTVAAALAGWGPYSLAAQGIATALATTLGLWQRTRWLPGDGASFDEIRRLLPFSGNLMGYNVFNYFIRNADSLLIGRFLGATELGHYSIAYKLMLWPVQNITGVLGRVLFPRFSRIQGDAPRLGKTYTDVTACVVLVAAPLMCAVFVVREPFVEFFLGSRWRPVADLLAWLAPIGLLQSIGALVGSVYLAAGRTDVMLKWGAFSGLLAVVGFTVGLHWGTQGVASAYLVLSCLYFWPSLAIPLRFIDLPVRRLVARFAPTLLCALLMTASMMLADRWLRAAAPSALAHLVLLSALGIVVYAAAIALWQRELLLSLLRAVVPRYSR